MEQEKQLTSLPENAYRELKPGEEYTPIMPASSSPREVTPYSVTMGIVMAVVFSAAAAFLGLKVGQVFEAAIPIAIIAVGMGNVLGKKNMLGQNVIIQSIGACSGVIVAGAIFTLPALYILGLDAAFYQVFLSSLFGGLLGIVLLLLFLLLSFISIAIWAAINSNTTGQRRMLLIISAYLMIWLAFGNLYYFFSDTENFVVTNTTSVEGLVKEWDGDMHVTTLQESTVLRNVPHFWELVPEKDGSGKEQLLPRTVNRLNGYIDCLYFSGVSILTIGYGDIVPESRFLKMLVLLEGFLGQFINVVAIGLWLSGVKGSSELKK